MPEVGEVAHAVAKLKRNLIGHTIKSASFLHDDKIFSGLKAEQPNKPPPKSSQSANQYQPEIKFASSKEIEDSLINKKIVNVGRHGKYFWIRTEPDDNTVPNATRESKHPDGLVILLHFGMTGWIKLKGIYSHFIQMESGGYKKVFKLLGADENGRELPKEEAEHKEQDVKAKVENPDEDNVVDAGAGAKDSQDDEDWPPRFHKFLLSLTDTTINGNRNENREKTIDLGFVDPRRLGKVRFYELTPRLSTDEGLLQNIEQLAKLGPDYSKQNSLNVQIKKEEQVGTEDQFVFGDPDPHDHGRRILSQSEFKDLFHSKPNLTIKPFLLKQEVFAGIGNWMADEILYQAHIYPEEVLGALDDSDVERLYSKVIEISQVAVQLEAEVTKFPKDWLMLYRWGKKEKKTYEGHEVKFVTVGGRTSCYVPSVQPKKSKKGKSKTTTSDSKPKAGKKRKIKEQDNEKQDDNKDEDGKEKKPLVKDNQESQPAIRRLTRKRTKTKE